MVVESVSARSAGRARRYEPAAAQDARLERVAVTVQVADRIGVEPAAVAVDRAPDTARVRGEVQPAHVDQPARDPELPAHVVPAESGVGLRCGTDLLEVA